MRVSLCGWAAKALEEAASDSDAGTKVTHNHPEGLAGARIIAECIFLARTGCKMSEIREYVEATIRN